MAEPQALRLLLVSCNAGLGPVKPDEARELLAVALSEDTGIEGDADVVALSLQECICVDPWCDAAAAAGFPRKLELVQLGAVTFLLLCSRAPGAEGDAGFAAELGRNCSVENEEAPRGAPQSKGCAATVLDLCGFTVCFCGCHLDGNLPGVERRVKPIPLAVLRASALVGGLHAALAFGDINCTLDPELPGAAAGCADVARLLGEDVAALRGAGKNAVAQARPETQEALQQALAIAATRDGLMRHFDSCPSSIPVGPDAAAPCDITAMRLQPMPAASLPSYRICAAGGRVYEALRAQAPGEAAVLPFFAPGCDLPQEAIRDGYFSDEKAGAIKKRGEMVRMNLGWLDRLYVGLAEGPAPVRAEVRQGRALQVPHIMDHAFMHWRVTLSRQ